MIVVVSFNEGSGSKFETDQTIENDRRTFSGQGYYREFDSLSDSDDLYGEFNPNLNTLLLHRRVEDRDRRRHREVFSAILSL